jgi:hypothetical protein
MKIIRFPIMAVFAACFLAAAAYAGDPTGIWQWTNKGHGDHVMKAALKLELKDGQLTGSLSSHRSETAIADASFKDDVVAFTVTREFHDQTVTIKYSGKLDGDTITGTIESPGRDGGAPMTHDWTATRVNPNPATAPAPASAGAQPPATT